MKNSSLTFMDYSDPLTSRVCAFNTPASTALWALTGEVNTDYLFMMAHVNGCDILGSNIYFILIVYLTVTIQINIDT